jgi:hypothetical protein
MTMLQLTRRPLSRISAPKKSITELGHPSYSLDLDPNDFWLFSEKSILKRRSFQDTEDFQNKSDGDTERYSTTRVPKMFSTMAASFG